MNRHSSQPVAVEKGRYRPVMSLGRGARFELVLSQLTGDAGFNKLAVLKRPNVGHFGDDDTLARLLRESAVAARLNHPNVVSTFEVGHDSDGPFIATEFLEGQSLRRVLAATHGSLPLPIVLRVLADVVAGLQHAHELRDYDGTPLEVVHRGVSPKNIFVLYTGRAKLLDFGGARTGGLTEQTSFGDVIDIRYVAPEQTRGEAGPQSDLFSVGVVMWECIAGRPFWGSMSPIEILTALGNDDFVANPPSNGTHVDSELYQLCAKALAVDPARRFGSARELLAAIERCMTTPGMSASARDVGTFLERQFSDDRASSRSRIQEILTPRGEAEAGDGDALCDDEVPVDLLAPAPPARSRSALVVAAVVVFLLGGAFAAVAWLRKPITVSDVAVLSPSAAASEALPPPSDIVPTAEPIHVAVDARPASATIVVDGVPAGNPYRATHPPDGLLHTIEIRADGFITMTRRVPFTADLQWDVGLEPGRLLRPPVVTPSSEKKAVEKLHAPEASSSRSPRAPADRAFDDTKLVVEPTRSRPAPSLDNENPWGK